MILLVLCTWFDHALRVCTHLMIASVVILGCRPGGLWSTPPLVLPGYRCDTHVLLRWQSRQLREHSGQMGTRSQTFLSQRSLLTHCHQKRPSHGPSHEKHAQRDCHAWGRTGNGRQSWCLELLRVFSKDARGSKGSVWHGNASSTSEKTKEERLSHLIKWLIIIITNHVLIIIHCRYCVCCQLWPFQYKQISLKTNFSLTIFISTGLLFYVVWNRLISAFCFRSVLCTIVIILYMQCTIRLEILVRFNCHLVSLWKESLGLQVRGVY